MFGEPGPAVDAEEALTVDTQLYSAEALFRASYAFTDRCYIFLREAGPSKVTVIFRKRQSPRALDSLVADFANELINQSLQVRLAAETKSVRDMIVAQAFREGDL